MTKKEAEEELRGLRELLVSYQRAYYIDGRPIVSDIEYDKNYDRLVDLERRFPDLVSPDSPSHRVGSDLDADFPEVPHTIPVLSLDKAYGAEEVVAWTKKVSAAAGRPLSFVLEEKIDGVSIVLYYENGLLLRAVTRGNGYVGNDVTANVKTIKTLPLRVDYPGILVVRGEIFLPLERFGELNTTLEFPYSNPRNLAGGTLRRNKSSEVAKIPLEIFVYDGYFSPPLENGWEVLEEFRRLGLPVNPRTVLIDPAVSSRPDLAGFGTGGAIFSPEDLPALARRYTAERGNLPYQIDGLVLKVNDLSLRERFGFTGHHPRWALAYKFESPEGLTRVVRIETQVGRTGRITPVARIEPVAIGGAVIENVTLHNQDYIDSLELSEGDLVAVSRRGDVIPAIERVIEKNDEAPLWRMPGICPSCGTPLVDRGAHRFCPNDEGCPDQRKGRLIFFASKGRMDIENLGTETMEFLWNEGLVRDIPDIYRIPYDKLLGRPGFGEKKVELIRRGVEKSRARPYQTVLSSLGIPEVGAKTVEILIDGGIDGVGKLFDIADRRDTAALTALNGIGEKTAERIVAEFARPEIRRLIADLEGAGLRFAAEKNGPAVTLPQICSGQTWCVTGGFENYKPRDLAMKEVEKRGGKSVTTLSGAVTHLLAGEGAGSKLEKAKSLGIRIVTEEEFLRLMNSSG
jgi:DNA ligase (NAD+)